MKKIIENLLRRNITIKPEENNASMIVGDPYHAAALHQESDTSSEISMSQLSDPKETELEKSILNGFGGARTSYERSIMQTIVEETICSVKNPQSYYNHYALNAVIRNSLINNDHAVLIQLGEDRNILVNLVEFATGSYSKALIPIRPIDSQGIEKEHFSGIYIQKNDSEGFSVAYIDPTGLCEPTNIPVQILSSIFEVLHVSKDQITLTTNKIQPLSRFSNLNNVHCGPFTGFILSGLSSENIRIEGNMLQQMNANEDWKDIPNLTRKQSNELGKLIRLNDAKSLTGKSSNLSEISIEDIVNRKMTLLSQVTGVPLKENFKVNAK